MRVDITLGTVGGVAKILADMSGLEQYYFKALEDMAIEILSQWPKYKLKNDRAALRYVNKLETKLNQAQAQLDGKWQNIGQVLNFLLAEVQDLYDDLIKSGSRSGKKNAQRLVPLIDMLEQYIETGGAYRGDIIDKALECSEIFKEAVG